MGLTFTHTPNPTCQRHRTISSCPQLEGCTRICSPIQTLPLSPPIILCTCCTSSSYWLEEALKPPLLLLPLSHLLLFIACRPLFSSSPGHRLITQCVLSLLVFSPLLSSPSKHYLLAPFFSFFPVCFFVDPEFLKTKQEHKQLHRFKNHCFLFQGFLLNLKTRHHSVSI